VIFMIKKKMPLGGVITKPGSSVSVKTGNWRSFKPIVTDKCKGCGICAKYCPEGAIEIKDKKATIDYDFCKGCMICATMCPFAAIKKEVEKK